jgi:hypothetical protein
MRRCPWQAPLPAGLFSELQIDRFGSDPRCGRIALFRRQRLTLAVLLSEPCRAESVDPRRGFSLPPGSLPFRIRSRRCWSSSKANCLMVAASALSRIGRFDRAEIFAAAADDDAAQCPYSGPLRLSGPRHRLSKLGPVLMHTRAALFLQ